MTRISDIASVRPSSSMQSISHYTVQRVVDVAANIDGRDLGSTAAEIKKIIAEVQKDLPSTVKIFLRGQNEVMETSFRNLGLGLILAIILVYAVLVVLFQSWVDPFIIMMAVPGALIGILWTLAMTGTTINVASLMGAIMSVGIAVSNSILVVSFANDLRSRNESLTPFEAVIEAGQDAAAPDHDDGAGDDHRHDPDGAGARRSRRAERAARPRRDRRSGVRDLRHAVPGADLLHPAAPASCPPCTRSTSASRPKPLAHRPEVPLMPEVQSPDAARAPARAARSAFYLFGVVARRGGGRRGRVFPFSRSNDVAVAREARASVVDRGPRVEVVAAAQGPSGAPSRCSPTCAPMRPRRFTPRSAAT